MSEERTLIGEHAGVRVYRTDRGFLKDFDEPSRAERERAALSVDLGCVVPEVLDHSAGQVLLSDVRAGRDGRARHVDLVSACAVLGRVHRARPNGVPTAEDAQRRLLARVEHAEPWLVARCRRLLVTGDAFCHRDLHPSNWICEDGLAVGLIDWASSGFADPESDLAQLGALPEVAISAWEASSGRVCDRDRLRLYQLVEAHERGERPSEAQLRPAGQGERSRCLAKPTGDHWGPLPSSDVSRVRGGLGALGLQVEVGPAYAAHACNDVVRLEWGGRACVLKVFNKPLPAWLVPFEVRLSEALRGSRWASVEPPLLLPHGGRVLRFEDRVALVYEHLGEEHPGNGSKDLVLLARAQAELHALGDLGLDREDADRFLPGTLLDSAGAHRELVQAALRDEPDRRGLPRSVVHGGLHRDHVLRRGPGLVFLDWEKVSVGPRVEGLARSAYHVGFRGNDENADVRRMVAYARAYHQILPLTAQELELLPGLILRAFVRDMHVHRERPAEQARIAEVLAEFVANEDNLRAALRRYLPRPQ